MKSVLQHGTHNCYCNHKCRCDECRAANAAYVRQMRRRNGLPESQRVIAKAQQAAVGWIKTHEPDVWQNLVDLAYAAAGVERQPVGRPRKGSAA